MGDSLYTRDLSDHDIGAVLQALQSRDTATGAVGKDGQKLPPLVIEGIIAYVLFSFTTLNMYTNLLTRRPHSTASNSTSTSTVHATATTTPARRGYVMHRQYERPPSKTDAAQKPSLTPAGWYNGIPIL